MENYETKQNEERLMEAKEVAFNNDKKSVFRIAIDKYITLLNSQMDSFPIIYNTLAVNVKACANHFAKFLHDKEVEVTKSEGDKEVVYKVPIEYGKEFEKIQDELSKSVNAYTLVPKNTVVAMVSLYDAYLANLIECAYIIKPQLLNASEKEFSYSDIMQFESMEKLKSYVIEKDVESIIRESHIKQFELLSKKFNVELTKDLPSYYDFIEITERRNLFVHTNGRISSQYLKYCKERPFDHKDKDVQIGENLSATPLYVEHCYNTLFEVGVKLGQVIWRKLENDLEKADDSLIDICYDLLKNQKISLACIITDFSCKSYVKHYNKVSEYVLCVNRALAYYLKGDKDKSDDIINSIDWSGAELKYRLAQKVLLEQYDDAIEIMKNIGKTNDMRFAYSEWPLFNRFRTIQSFKDAYKTIYGQEYQYSETQQTQWEDVIKEAMELIKETKGQKTPKGDAASSEMAKTNELGKRKKKQNNDILNNT